MERIQNLFTQRQGIAVGKLFDFTPLHNAQKSYLAEVYAILAGTVVLTTVGLQFSRYVFAIPLFLSAICQFISIMYIFSTQGYHQTFKDATSFRRLVVLGCLSFFSGCSLEPLVDIAYYVNPNILSSALLATTVAFLCFSFGAMFAKQRKFLFLGSILTSMLSYLSLVSLFNIFFQSSLAHDIVLYAGLLTYLGFIVYDTQCILLEHSQGTRDPVLHALTFYVDIVGLFIRLTTILIQRNRQSSDERERKKM